ncbi:MAG: sulfur carrier protein ThiS [Verrucomicrobia bacterium]|nr:sulfur carrier protein ThiS [Verrucomicrobiota bacterium]
MEIILNGEPQKVESARTISELVAVLNLPVPALLVEHNGTALHRAEWDACALHDGDRVEVIRIVAGG